MGDGEVSMPGVAVYSGGVRPVMPGHLFLITLVPFLGEPGARPERAISSNACIFIVARGSQGHGIAG